MGAERALKDSVRRAHPELRFAFSRPGFLTWKSEREVGPEVELRAPLARLVAKSLGRVAAASEAARLGGVVELLKGCVESPATLHVFARDHHEPGREPEGYDRWVGLAELAGRLRAEAPELFVEATTPGPGALVVDVVVLEPEVWWVALHRHGPRRAPWPGAIYPTPLPASAPSRAYGKLAEVCERFAVPLARGDVALEVGSAPGGAALYLLERGVSVHGVDSARMAEIVTAYDGRAAPARFVHHACSVGNLLPSARPRSVDWLLVDMNAEPEIALRSVDELAYSLFGSLRGAILTLKLNDWSLAAELGRYQTLVERWGIRRSIVQQLSRHRREVVLYGLTARGAERASVK